jgi:hypothetical protein
MGLTTEITINIGPPLTLHPDVEKKLMSSVPLNKLLSEKMDNCPTISFIVPQAYTLFETKLSQLEN